MPFTPVETPKCPKCGKSVYAAEERVAGGYKYHKTCFKCGMCNKALDSTNCTEHEKELFCKNCHARKYGPKGYGFGGGAGCLSMDTGAHLNRDDLDGVRNGARLEPRVIAKAPEGQGCPRCGGYVYAAEQMLARGRPWHKECFKCGACSKGLDSILCCEGPDKNIYCKSCYAKKFGPKGYGYGQGGGALQSDCYANGDMAPKTADIDVGKIQARPGEGCPRCGGVVFAAECVLSKGREWHRKCFKCRDCTKTLDSIIACDGPDKDVYCKTCYGKKWGPHGYGFACGSSFLQTDGLDDDQITSLRPFINPDTTSIKAPEGEGCPRCGGAVFAAEQQLSKGRMWHKKCYNCGDCHRPLDSMLACDGPDGNIYCKACYGKNYGPKGFGFGHTPTLVCSTTGENSMLYDLDGVRNGARLEPRVIAKAPEGQGCPRCGGYVYAAEQMLARGRPWHKECFKCGACSKGLDSILCCEGPDKNIYCKSCYAKKFGPKGYGYGQGGGALQSDCYANGDMAPKTADIDVGKIQARPGEGCPRCGGVVFAAECVLSKGREWHRKCFKCRDCTKTLDSIIACDGPDKDVYCKTCYGKKWGPHGYGFACGSSFLQTDGLDDDQITSLRPFINPDTTSIKAPEGEGCPRCGGAVFAAEQQLSKGRMWHKKCYNCGDCHRPLDSMLACDGPDGNIYCKACYGKNYGPKGFGFGHTPTLVCSTTGENSMLYSDGKPLCGPRTPGGCPRCGYAVFAAEQMISKSRIWHKRCFHCADCRKSLDSTNLNDGPDGDIYCRSCYGRNFGPKGVGYGLGAGTLTMA